MKTHTIRLIAFAAVVLPLAVGCGGPKFLTVTGRVTHKGKPVPSTQVRFLPDNGERPSNGLTDDDGHFTLKYSRTQAGTLAGKYTVVLSYVESNEEFNHQIPPKASKELRKVIETYADPKTSPLHYEIAEDGQHVEINLN